MSGETGRILPIPETTPAVEFAEALLAVQDALPHFDKGAKAKVETKGGGSYEYDYADLTTITDAALPVLNKHGFSFICLPHLREDDKQFVLRYVLLHKAGHSVTGDYPLGTGSAQQIGSAITYGRRYCLCAVTGIAPAGEDDDGAKASEPRQPSAPTRETDPVWMEDVQQRITAATTLTDLTGIRGEANHKYEKFALTQADAGRLKDLIEQRESELRPS